MFIVVIVIHNFIDKRDFMTMSLSKIGVNFYLGRSEPPYKLFLASDSFLLRLIVLC